MTNAGGLKFKSEIVGLDSTGADILIRRACSGIHFSLGESGCKESSGLEIEASTWL